MLNVYNKPILSEVTISVARKKKIKEFKNLEFNFSLKLFFTTNCYSIDNFIYYCYFNELHIFTAEYKLSQLCHLQIRGYCQLFHTK